MGKLWRVDKALEDSEGLRWVRERLGTYDWAKVDWITVRRGRSERYAFRGVCRSPWEERGYRINCNVSRHAPYPITYYMRVSPCTATPTERGRRCPKVTRQVIAMHRAAMVSGPNGEGCTDPWNLGARTRYWCSWSRTRLSNTFAGPSRLKGGTAK